MALSARGYFMRYFADRVVTSDALVAGLERHDPAITIDDGLVLRDEARFAEIEIGGPGQAAYDEELEDLIERLDGHELAQRLRSARSAIVVRVLFQDRDTEETLAVVDHVWAAAAELSPGLLYADGEGLYDGDRLVFAIGGSPIG